MSDPSLWQYALSVWRRPAVERQCLLLQDDYQVPVSLLLAGLWLAERGMAPDDALATRLADLAEHWEETFLRPLRRVRRAAGASSQGQELKRRVLEAELEAEKTLLEALQAQVKTRVPGASSVSALSWLLLLVPDAGRCEGIQQALERLITESQAVNA